MEKKRTFKKTSDIGFDRPRRSKTENKKGSKSNFDKKKDFKKGNDNKKKFDKPKSFKKPNDDKKKFDKPVETKPVEKVEKTEKTSNVRYYIYKCLYNIYINKAFSNIEIDHIIRENKINELDAKLLTNIVYGTLSHDKILNWELKQLCQKAPKDQAKIIILMSLYQLKYLDRIPDFAILNEAVSIAKKEGGEQMGKFVNAILRESLRQELKFTKELAKDEYEYLSLTYNMPVWVIKMWEKHYGKAKTLSLLEYSNKEAPLSVRVNIHKSNKEEILKNPDFVSGQLAKNALTYEGATPIAQTEEMKKGLISVQDESSQYVVEVLDPQKNSKVLDMCAAPGSKTQYICELMENTGKVLALDIHPHRVEIMKKYLASLNLTNVTCICYDSTKLHEKQKLVESFDKVLLDAPCLGLGVVRRKPDILLDLKDENLDEIVLIQQRLLEEAYLMLKEGGELVYSTCSINKKENDSQVTAFLSKHKDMKRVFEKQLFPDEFNSDGFYIAKMVKE